MLTFNYNRYNSELNTNNIYKIICDNNGTLWISTDQGLTDYNGSTFKNYNQLINNEVVNLFYQKKSSKLYALTYNAKLQEINTNNMKIKEIPTHGKIYGALMYAYENKDSLFFLTSAQRFKLSGDKLVQVPVNSQVYKQYLDMQGNNSPFTATGFYKEITWESLFKQDIRSDVFSSRNFFRLEKFNTISIYGKIFTQYKGKYYNIIDSTKFQLKKNQFITDIEIVNNDFYISVYGANGGIFLAKDYLTNPEKSVFKRISEVGNGTSVCKDKLNNIWYSLLGKGLFVINKPELKNEIIHVENITQNNNHFMALNDSLILFKEGSFESSQIKLINNNSGIVASFKLNDKRITKAQKEIYTSMTGKDEMPYKDVSHDKRMRFVKDYIKYISPDNKNHILLTNKNKIYRKGDYFGNTVILYAENDSIYFYDLRRKRIERQFFLKDIGIINDIYFLNNTTIYICAKNGFFSTDLSFKLINKLSNKVFKKVLVNDQHVFFSNDQGIEYMDLRKNVIRQIFNVQSYSPIFSILDFDLSKNKIHVLTNIGYINLDQSIISTKPTSITFNLAEIILKDSTLYSPKKNIDINRLSAKEIKFIVHFLNPENRFHIKSYSLTKRDDPDNWRIFTADNFAWNNAPPGKYTLKIKAAFSGALSDNILAYSITIIPLFWESNWFVLLSVFLSTISVITITWIILKSKEKKQLEKVTLEKHILEIENRAFLNQLKPHFLFNALNTLQDYMISKDTHNGILYLQHVTSLHRNILQFNAKSSITVTEEKEFLERYLYLQQKRFSDRFNFSIHVNKNAGQLKLPPMLLQPIVENIIEHGFANHDPGKEISIEFKKIYNQLYVRVDDNGDGKIEGIFPLKEGHALQMISERLRFINIKNNSTTNRINFMTNYPRGIMVIITIDL